MRTAAFIPLAFLLGLGACGKAETGLFADRSIPMIAPAASADTPPHYVGRWAAAADQCNQPWVIQARSLQEGGINCEFDRVDTSSAGYTVASLCRMSGGPQPSRLTIVMPAGSGPATTLTISGGPFKNGVALQRCVS